MHWSWNGSKWHCKCLPKLQLDRVHAKSRIINSFSQVTDKYQYDEEGATIFYVSLWRHCLQPEQRFSKSCVRWGWLSYALFTLSCEIIDMEDCRNEMTVILQIPYYNERILAHKIQTKIFLWLGQHDRLLYCILVIVYRKRNKKVHLTFFVAVLKYRVWYTRELSIAFHAVNIQTIRWPVAKKKLRGRNSLLFTHI